MRTGIKAVGALALGASAWGGVLVSTGAGASATESVVIPAGCTGDGATPHMVFVGSGNVADGQYGLVVLPTAPPVGIVAVEHGYQQTAESMVSILQTIVAKEPVIAFAMDYTGTADGTDTNDPYGLPTSSRGWRVTEGAADTEAVAAAYDGQCQSSSPQRLTNVLFGVSMGGDTSGIAAAAGADRADKSALFDYWFDGSGVSDLTETYLEATLDSPVSAYASDAVTDIQAETGGTPATVPQTYLADSPVTLAPSMKSAGIKGAVVLHAIMDGLVTSDEGDQMLAALTGAHVPTDFYTAVLQAPGAKSSTLDGDLIGQADKSYVSPFAGHVEGIILTTALDRLHALFTGSTPSGLSVTLADGQLGSVPVLSLPGA
jgi:hypothetical protein